MYHLAITLSLMAAASAPRVDENWPDFRGPRGNGHGQADQLPLHWSEEHGVVWKTAIPGKGWSSPVVWGRQVWMTSATPDGHEMFAIAVDRRTGRIEHRVKVFDVDEPHEIDPTNSYASPSPVIERDRVYVHFGTYGTACLDTRTARILWSRRDLPVDHQKGPGSSPVLFDDLLIFQRDGNDVQCILALDKATGKTVWTTDRSVDLSGRASDYRKSFSTPLLLQLRERYQLVSTAAGAVYGYDPRSGRELWHVEYAGHTMVSRPVAENDILVINTGYPRPELWGLRLEPDGSATRPAVVWKRTRSLPIKPSVILVDERIYMVTDSGGIVTCLNAVDGSALWQQRLGGNHAASPLLVRDRIYFFSEEGRATVIRAGREYQPLAVNSLAAGCLASPAVAGESLFVRTKTHLYRIETDGLR